MSRCYHCGEVDAHCYLCRNCGQIYCVLHKDPEVHECILVRKGAQNLQGPNQLIGQTEWIENVGEGTELQGRADGNYTWYRPLGAEYQELEKATEVRIVSLGRLVLNKDSVEELAALSILRGNGSIQNPYTFAHLTNYPSSILILDIDCYLSLEGFTLRSLVLRECRNITINGNKIGVMSLIDCSDLSIINNEIHNIGFKRIEGNFISGNRMSKFALKELESCNDGGVKLASFLGHLSVVLIFSVSIPGAIILFLFGLKIIGSTLIVFSFLFALSIVVLIEKKIRISKKIKKPNIITENISVSLS